VLCGAEVNRLNEGGSTVIDIERPVSPAGSQQVVINVADVVRQQTPPVNGSVISHQSAPSSPAGTLPPTAAGSISPTVVDQVAVAETPAAAGTVSVAVKAPASQVGAKSTTSRRCAATTLNASAEV